MNQLKSDLRRQMKTLRPRSALASDSAQSLSLYKHLQRLHGLWPRTAAVALYWPLPGEFDLRPLLNHWQADARQLLLPVTIAPGQRLQFRVWTPQVRMGKDAAAVPAPLEGAFVEPDIMLIPAVGADYSGRRLGYGAGYYDATIQALGQRCQSIGVLSDALWTPSINPDTWDAVIRTWVTPSGVLRIAT